MKKASKMEWLFVLVMCLVGLVSLITFFVTNSVAAFTIWLLSLVYRAVYYFSGELN